MTAICVAKSKLLVLVDLYICCASWYVTQNACLAIKPVDPFEHVRLPYWTDHWARKLWRELGHWLCNLTVVCVNVCCWIKIKLINPDPSHTCNTVNRHYKHSSVLHFNSDHQMVSTSNSLLDRVTVLYNLIKGVDNTLSTSKTNKNYLCEAC